MKVLIFILLFVSGLGVVSPSYFPSWGSTLIPDDSKRREQDFRRISFEIMFDKNLGKGLFTGRVLLFFSKDIKRDPLKGPFPGEHPFFGFNIKRQSAGESFRIRGGDVDFWNIPPEKLSGTYSVRAVFDHSSENRNYLAPGNFLSDKYIIDVNRVKSGLVRIRFSSIIKKKISRTMQGKKFNIKSRYLSSFWGRDVFVESRVILPVSYNKNSEKLFPVIFFFPGAGEGRDNEDGYAGYTDSYIMGFPEGTKEKIVVVLRAEFKRRTHYYVNSLNNGPWRKALTDEFMPLIEKQFRIRKDQKFLCGRAEGAWTALWLMVTEPDMFSAVFADNPPALDFSVISSAKESIYSRNSNWYFAGKKRDPLSIKIAEKKRLSVKAEHVLGKFGTIRSMEMAFGPERRGGKYELFDRESGLVDSSVARCWEKFDFNLYVRNNYHKLKHKLKEKIHVYVSSHKDSSLVKAVKKTEQLFRRFQIEGEFRFYKSIGTNLTERILVRHVNRIIDSRAGN